MTHFSFINFILSLAAAAALLIWAVRLVRTGVERAFGRQLRAWMIRSAQSRLLASTSGVLAALLLQSSTAVLALIAGFSGSSAFSATVGTAVLLGADLGSALVVKLITLNTSALMPLFLLAGVVLFLRGGAAEIRQVGRILIGLALIFVSLQMIRDAAAPLVGNTNVERALGYLGTDLVSAFVIGAILAWAVHSSVATVLIVVSLAAQGLLQINAVAALVLGANLGSCLIAVGLTLHGPQTAKAIVYANCLARGGSAIFVLMLLNLGIFSPAWLGDGAAATAMNLHVAFNLAVLLVFLPATFWLSQFAEKLIGIFAVSKNHALDQLPDPAQFIDKPKQAIPRIRRELIQLGQLVDDMLCETTALLFDWQSTRAETVVEAEDTVQRRHGNLKLFIAALRRHDIDDDIHQDLSDLIGIGSGLEAAAKTISGDLLAAARSLGTQGLSFSATGQTEIAQIADFVSGNIEAALVVLEGQDFGAATDLIERKARIRELEERLQQNHFQRLSDGNEESVATSNQHQGVLRSLKLINSCFAQIPSSLLNRGGKLSQTRLTKP